MSITLIFYFFMMTAATSALGLLLIRNVFKGALLLLTCLLSVAAIYVLMFAEFVAVAQILVYAGGILVVIIFGIMLTTGISGRPLRVSHAHIFIGIVAGGLLLLVLVNMLSTYIAVPPSLRASGNIQAIGMNFMTSFMLPFEVAGILLLVSLVGAAVVTSFMKSKKL